MLRKQRTRIPAVSFALVAQKKRILAGTFSSQAQRVSLQEESIMEVVPASKDSEKITLSTENIADENRILNTGGNTSEDSLLQ